MTNKQNKYNNVVIREGIFGGIKKLIKKAVNKVANAVKKTFLKPINAMKNAIMKPIRSIEDFIRMVLCLALFLQNMFAWFSQTLLTLTKYFLAAPFCFMFWVLDSLVLCVQYIIIDVILNLLLQPAIYIGNMLGYPFVDDIKITGEYKKTLYENTNLLRMMVNCIDNGLDLPFKIHDKCFGIEEIKPFPKYYS